MDPASSPMTFSTKRTIGTIRIVPSDNEPRVVCEGSIVNTADGAPLRAFEEDITDRLSPDEAAAVALLTARGRQWLDGKD